MWVFTKDGFFAVAENRNDKDTLLVRARVADDMNRLVNTMEAINMQWVRLPWRDEEADYLFRGIMTKFAWAYYLGYAAREIDYDSLKSYVMQTDGKSRYQVMTVIWNSIAHLELMKGPFRKKLVRMGVR